MREIQTFCNPGNFLPVLRNTLLCVAVITVVFLSRAAHAEEIMISGTGGGLATMQLLATAYAKTQPGDKITVLPSLGSSGGIKAVLSGKIQLAVSARPLKDTEIKAGAVEYEFGRTPFVFATAKTNKTVSVTLDELVSMYAGKTERWPDGTLIRLVLRPLGDSDSEMIKSMSEAMRKAKIEAEQRKGMAFAVTDQEAADNLEKIPGSLGPSTLAQILTEDRKLKALQLNKVEPSPQSIANGSYPYYKQMFFVTISPAPSATKQFVAFVKSAPGREILVRNGYWVQ